MKYFFIFFLSLATTLLFSFFLKKRRESKKKLFYKKELFRLERLFEEEMTKLLKQFSEPYLHPRKKEEILSLFAYGEEKGHTFDKLRYTYNRLCETKDKLLT